ncbi:IS30 family transposase [uncultured Microbacterium sp.]|uniref:IS30 family transposase n=1 Tax=uncultured Microbacterium sp. TaxID=191216 RepID=UPI00374A814A
MGIEEFEIRADRKVPQGRRKLTAEREAYAALVEAGFSYRAAATIVGVNYRTTKRWRAGSWGNIPASTRQRARVRKPGDGISDRFLSEDDRIAIADALRAGDSIRKIAQALGRSPSTISREVKRNASPVNGSYRPYSAQQRADARLPRPRVGKIARNAELRDYIQRKLELRWSPEQITHLLRREFPDRPEMQVVHETIYQALYIQGRGELRRELTRALRTGRVRRKTHKQAQMRQPRYRDPMVMISDRPAEIEDRAVPGHWEGDLIIGANQKSAIATLVERTTRYTMLVHLPADRTALTVSAALVKVMQTLPAQLRRSLTWDQGSEMGKHRAFTLATDIPVYFCDPASPWQRGSNENTNGLLRQYFPKGSDLSQHSAETLDLVASELNTRPRKTLDWDTPAKRLAALIDAA